MISVGRGIEGEGQKTLQIGKRAGGQRMTAGIGIGVGIGIAPLLSAPYGERHFPVLFDTDPALLKRLG
jgi:hypothetical protein